VIDFQIFRHITLRALGRVQHHGELLGFLLHLDRVVVLHQVGRNVHALAVHQQMPVGHELPRRERSYRKFQAIGHGVQAPLQDLDQVLRGVALPAHGFLVVLAELLLADVAVVALQLLLRHQLGAEVRGLLAALAMLARAVFPLVDGRFRPAPEVDAEAAVNLVLGFGAFGHGRVGPFVLLLHR
jgi:hypothetical protein